jgi:UDP-glucuronate decarboxylase
MNNLLLGGAGFIGQHLAHKLLKTRMERVTIIDNLKTSKINLEDFAEYKNLFRFVEADLTTIDDKELLDHMKDNRRIFHLAGSVGVEHIDKDPSGTLFNNIALSSKLMPLFKQAKRHVTFASTSEIYGDPKVHPQPEEYWGNVNPIGIRSCYDEGKRAAETLFYDYYRVHNVNAKIVRIFNTYGPRMATDDGRVVSNFIVQALRGKNITIYGSGLQTRSFCYVDDLIDGMMAMMNTDNEMIGPLNLGNPGEFTMFDLANMVIKLTGTDSQILQMPLPQDDPKQRQPNINKTKQVLQWEPKIDLETGLQKTIDYFRKIV